MLPRSSSPSAPTRSVVSESDTAIPKKSFCAPVVCANSADLKLVLYPLLATTEEANSQLHLGVDGTGMIVAQELTGSNVDDASTGEKLIDATDGHIARVVGDAAYDTVAMYKSATARGADVVVPPARTATVSRRGPRSTARDGTIRRVKEVGRRRWKKEKKESGYHQQSGSPAPLVGEARARSRPNRRLEPDSGGFEPRG